MADYTTITAAVDALPYEQQRRLAAHLRDKGLAALADRRPAVRADESWAHYRRLLLLATGKDITARVRGHAIVAARNCAFAQMQRDGYRIMEIAHASGYHHATVIHALEQVDTALDHPDTDTPFTSAWQRFQYLRQL